VLRIIFGPKKEVTGRWRKSNNEELHNWYTLPVIGVIKCRRIRWARQVACVGLESFVTPPPRFPVYKLKEYNTQNTILTNVLYGCESWSLALREEHKIEGV
jgi:hypothetical protein